VNISIIGTGYVGLVSGVCLASKGHDVTCVDVNTEIVNKLNKGIATIYEKDLQSLLTKTLKQNKFRATSNINDALHSASIVIIAVGTPSKNENIDLSYVQKVSQIIGNYIKHSNKFLAVIVKSTVVPGTTDTFIRKEIENFSSKKIGQFGLGMNPEFLREGKAVEDFINPDRIILGYETDKTLSLLKELYMPWNVDKLFVNSRTAELIKYTNNFLLATQISAINEIANFASALGGVDIMEVVNGIHLDKRWNPAVNGIRSNPEILKYLVPGCGFGGSCFPKDINALKSQGKKIGVEMIVAESIININNKQPYQVIKIIEKEFKKLSEKKILLLGLAFKPETDDVRESPAIKIITDLLKKKAFVTAHDPEATENFKLMFNSIASKINFVKNWKDVIDSNDIIIITTPWDEYQFLKNFDLKAKLIIDAKSAFSSNSFKNAIYRSIGTRK
jgi:UDPglucose 6-dehydrogenase